MNFLLQLKKKNSSKFSIKMPSSVKFQNTRRYASKRFFYGGDIYHYTI